MEESRSHENCVRLELPVEEVWRALTVPEDLARWFAPEMTVEPGEGGFMLANWGPGLEWRTQIEVWEPNQRLRLTETRDRVMSSATEVEALHPCRLIQDYYLEAKDGGTVLRLVHSGFGWGEGWDNEFEGTRSGWASCFGRMKEALERHAGEPLENFLFVLSFPGQPAPQVLRRVEGIAPEGAETLLRTESHLQLRLASRNGAIVTFSAQPARAGAILYVEWLLFVPEPGARAKVETEWRRLLAGSMPE